MYVFKDSLTIFLMIRQIYLYIIKIPLRLFSNQKGLNSDAKNIENSDPCQASK